MAAVPADAWTDPYFPSGESLILGRVLGFLLGVVGPASQPRESKAHVLAEHAFQGIELNELDKAPDTEPLGTPNGHRSRYPFRRKVQ